MSVHLPVRPLHRQCRAILAACLLATLPAASAQQGVAMADAMLNMMQAMGMFRSDDTWRRLAEDWGQPPADDAGQPAGPAADAPGGRLDGIWQGRGGEWLLVRGDYFRLLSGRGQQVDGMLRIRGSVLSLFVARAKRPWVYEFAEDQGRLVLRDSAGNLFLYRRREPADAAPGSLR